MTGGRNWCGSEICRDLTWPGQQRPWEWSSLLSGTEWIFSGPRPFHRPQLLLHFTFLLLWLIIPRVSPLMHVGQSSLILFGPIQKVKLYSHHRFLHVSSQTTRPAIIAHINPTILLDPLRHRLCFWSAIAGMPKTGTSVHRASTIARLQLFPRLWLFAWHLK